MRFDVITVFPQIFSAKGGSLPDRQAGASGRDSCGYLNHSMIKRARAKKLVDIRIHDLRKFALDKHKKVDDRPYGGGPGMVLKIEPLIRAIFSILRTNSKFQIPNYKQNGKSKFSKSKTKIVLFSAAGKQFTQKMAADWAKKYDRIVMIAGRYEGVDERIKKVIKNWKLEIENLSIGPYVLSGGELPAMVVTEAVARHIPGFLGKAESLEEKRHGVGVPMYTRPEIFAWRGRKYRVPKVLLSGGHAEIEKWRSEHRR